MRVLLSQLVVKKEDVPDEWLGAHDFTESIKARGVQEPIQVVRLSDPPKAKRGKNYTSRYLLVHGRHRWWSAKCAQQREIDVEVVKLDPNNRRQHLEFALVSNEVQTDVDPVTRGKRYEQLIDQGATVEEIAELTKKSISFIYQHLDLLKLIPPIQEAVRWGRVSFSQARELLRLDENAQIEAWNELTARAQARDGQVKDLPLNEVRSVVRAFRALDAAHKDEYAKNDDSTRNENGNGHAQVGDEHDWANTYQAYLKANALAEEHKEDRNGGTIQDPLSSLEEIAEQVMALADASDERGGESPARKLARRLYATIAQIESLLREVHSQAARKNIRSGRKV